MKEDELNKSVSDLRIVNNRPSVKHRETQPCSNVKSAPAVRQHQPGPDRPNLTRKAAAMKATQPVPLSPIDWRTRCHIALSLASNEKRDPARNIALIKAALEGATVQDLLDIEQLRAGKF